MNKCKKIWLNFVLKPLIAIMLAVVACLFFNFLLVTPPQSSTISTTMADVKAQEENIDVVFLGTSMTFRDIDAVALSQGLDKNVFNIAYENGDYYTSYYLLKEVTKTNNLEKLFLESSIHSFSRENSTEDIEVYKLLSKDLKYDFAKGIGLDYVDFPLLEFTNYLKNFSNERFFKTVTSKLDKKQELGANISTKHSIYKGHGFVCNTNQVSSPANLILPKNYFYHNKIFDESNVDKKQLEYYHNILKLCEEKNIEVVLYSPTYVQSVVKEYKDDFKNFNRYIADIASDYDVTYLDLTKLKHKHFAQADEYFYNANHFNGKGAKAMAEVLQSIYQELENGTYNASYWFNESH